MQNERDRTEGRETPQWAVLVGMHTGGRSEITIEDSMAELAELASAAGAEVRGSLIQNRATIDPATYIGKGKVEEVRLAVEMEGADIVIFNDELSGAQIRNLEAALDCRVVDRTALILDIFAQRARTNVARLQVELAQLRYTLPRLTGLGASMSRTGGGIGTRGPGEQKLEMDRRRIREKITDLMRELDDEKRIRETQRSRRQKSEIPVVALVGYTNAGKSTVMNRLLRLDAGRDDDKQVFEKDMLFATLDTNHRRISLEDRKDFVLIDTVGFVSKLPHALVQAFKATLEEVAEADLLLQVVDVSNENYRMQIQVTETVLRELGVQDKKMIYLYNKIDRLPEEAQTERREDVLNISAKRGDGMEALVERLRGELFSSWQKVRLLIPYAKGELMALLHDSYTVRRSEYQADGILVEAELDEAAMGRLSDFGADGRSFEDEAL